MPHEMHDYYTKHGYEHFSHSGPAYENGYIKEKGKKLHVNDLHKELTKKGWRQTTASRKMYSGDSARTYSKTVGPYRDDKVNVSHNENGAIRYVIHSHRTAT